MFTYKNLPKTQLKEKVLNYKELALLRYSGNKKITIQETISYEIKEKNNWMFMINYLDIHNRKIKCMFT